ncbi:xylan 1,4-beta-xylosidase Talaromyces emersonii [Exophiala viscosa]|uniref:xylan 1,4-beta-xylosidase Talaromyces emersonii n=1 Tax=Exophiala viscosa TaxID=2486360 RepID=UPI002196DA26|nr:xylan 1,4-beta-xylosidase Talaromyces emersonii [Exophiala viscosa]
MTASTQTDSMRSTKLEWESGRPTAQPSLLNPLSIRGPEEDPQSLRRLQETLSLTPSSLEDCPKRGSGCDQILATPVHSPFPHEWQIHGMKLVCLLPRLNRAVVGGGAAGGRAFSNAGKYGLDSYAPNINGFRSPVWGRGQETPGEDAFFLTSAYAYEYITALQGGVEPDYLKIVATQKHFAGYDLESWNDQDLAGYYTPQFKAAIRDARANSLMCSYNAVNGVPSCANSYLLQTLLRDTWGFSNYDGYVSADCDSVVNVWEPHYHAYNLSIASSDSLLAGTDIDCGHAYADHLNESIIAGAVAPSDVAQGVFRLYSNLVRLGYFDGNSSTVYRQLTWEDVVSTDAQNISYESAVQGITLLKNDGTLPLGYSSSVKSIAVIGPWANATDQMLGNYYGVAPYIISPLQAAQDTGLEVNFALGTNISTTSTEDFSGAIAAANASDVVIYMGGIDNTLEEEALDRENITWPGNQLDLIAELATMGKPVVVLQMGGGQVDSSTLKNNPNISALVWGGYPGQAGGAAIVDILTGKRAPADFVDAFNQTIMDLRPNSSNGNPGQTYMWYTGTPVYPFGAGEFYTNFSLALGATPTLTAWDTINVTSQAHPGYDYVEMVPLLNLTFAITNTGSVTSDYSAMLFANTTNAGPAPYPNKWLVGFDRLSIIAPGETASMTIPVPIGTLARFDDKGNTVLYPGIYDLELNNERSVVVRLTFTGPAVTLSVWPRDAS